jgi:hypothetical protein
MLPNPQQQLLLLQHLFGTQGLAYARSLAQVQGSAGPGAYPYPRFAPQGAGVSIMQPAHLPDGQGPWMV